MTSFYYMLWIQAFGTFLALMVNLFSHRDAGVGLYRKAFCVNLLLSILTVAFLDRCPSSITHAGLSFLLAGLCGFRWASIPGAVALAGAHFSQLISHPGASAYPILVGDTGALACAASLLAMLLGHSYLTKPQMSFDLLKRATMGLLVLIVVDAAVSGSLALSVIPDVTNLPDFILWMGISKLFFGIVAAGIFAFLAYRCASMFSNRSATGILYVVCVFTIIGSVSGIYFFSKS